MFLVDPSILKMSPVILLTLLYNSYDASSWNLVLDDDNSMTYMSLFSSLCLLDIVLI